MAKSNANDFKKFLFFSATSEIAKQTIKKFAKEGTEFYLTGRDETELEKIKGDLLARGAKVVDTKVLDVLNIDKCKEAVKDAFSQMKEIDCVFIAQGILPKQDDIEYNVDYAVEVWNVNTTSVIAISIAATKHLVEQGYGTLAVISSVAADRGRQVNYLYGGTKAGVSVFLEGLRMRLHSLGIQIIDIKPGPVKTPMTKNMGKTPLLSSSEKVASDIVSGIYRNKGTIYTPMHWSLIMKVVKIIPEPILRRLPI